jgi:hypothetical protein
LESAASLCDGRQTETSLDGEWCHPPGFGLGRGSPAGRAGSEEGDQPLDGRQADGAEAEYSERVPDADQVRGWFR